VDNYQNVIMAVRQKYLERTGMALRKKDGQLLAKLVSIVLVEGAQKPQAVLPHPQGKALRKDSFDILGVCQNRQQSPAPHVYLRRCSQLRRGDTL